MKPKHHIGSKLFTVCFKVFKENCPWVDIQIIEEHFKGKDGVSGTALKIAQALDLEKEDINSFLDFLFKR